MSSQAEHDITTTDEFQMLPLTALVESPTNPRRHMDAQGIDDLASSMTTHGVLLPLLVRRANGKKANGTFEIISGARRYRAAAQASLNTVPVRVCVMDDTEALEVQVIENLQREDVHPLDEGIGYRALLDHTGHDVSGIAAKVGKSESYVYQRLQLSSLTAPAQKAFLAGDMTAGHAILIARLQERDQLEVMKQCLKPVAWNLSKAGKGMVSVRHLIYWIQERIHLDLHTAPFNTDDLDLIPSAGTCLACPKRTGCNEMLFPDIKKKDTCTDPGCFQAKMKAFISIQKAAAAQKGKEVLEVTTAYWTKGKHVLGEHQWKKANAGACKAVTPAIIVEGKGVGNILTICPDTKCKVHHRATSGSAQASELRTVEKQRKQKDKIARETRVRTLQAIGEKVKSLEIEDLRLIVSGLWSLMGNEHHKAYFAMRGWDGHTDDLLKPHIQPMDVPELHRCLVELALMRSVEPLSHDAGLLSETAKRYRVDIAKIAVTVSAELKKPAKTGTQPKTSSVKTKPAAKGKGKGKKVQTAAQRSKRKKG